MHPERAVIPAAVKKPRRGYWDFIFVFQPHLSEICHLSQTIFLPFAVLLRTGNCSGDEYGSDHESMVVVGSGICGMTVHCQLLRTG